MLVAHEGIAAEGVGGGQRDRERDDRVHHHIDQAVHIAHIPARIGQDRGVVREGQVTRPEREHVQDFRVRLQAHVDEPVDRQEQEDEVDRHHDGTSIDAGRGGPANRNRTQCHIGHHTPSLLSRLVITV